MYCWYKNVNVLTTRLLMNNIVGYLASSILICCI